MGRTKTPETMERNTKDRKRPVNLPKHLSLSQSGRSNRQPDSDSGLPQQSESRRTTKDALRNYLHRKPLIIQGF